MADKKMVFVATYGAENPEKAIVPFVMANAALASDMDATIVLQSSAVMLAIKDYAKHVRAEGFPPLPDLIKNFRDTGGKLLVCVPCLKARGIEESQLIEGAKQVAAGSVVSEASTAVSTMVY